MKNHYKHLLIVVLVIAVLYLLLGKVESGIVLPLLLLICPISMGIMMWSMNKDQHKH